MSNSGTPLCVTDSSLVAGDGLLPEAYTGSWLLKSPAEATYKEYSAREIS